MKKKVYMWDKYETNIKDIESIGLTLNMKSSHIVCTKLDTTWTKEMKSKSGSISRRDDIVCETADEIRHQRSVEYTTTRPRRPLNLEISLQLIPVIGGGTYLTEINFLKFFRQFHMVIYVG